MANKEISELTAASTPLDGSELLHGVQGGNSRKLTAKDILLQKSISSADQATFRDNVGAASRMAGLGNLLYNPDGLLNTRGATSVSDDAYGHDRHYALTQTASINISTLTAPASGLRSMMRLDQNQASAQRMGYAQILPASDTYGQRGKVLTLGGKLRFANAAAVRFAVLEWTGTADAVTSDVIASWTSGTYTAGNFFLGSNLTVTAVGSITPSAATITDWALQATIGASANNLIVLYWTEGTAAQNSTLDMAWHLMDGSIAAGAVSPVSRPVFVEQALCVPFCEVAYVAGASGQAVTSTDMILGVRYAPKRTGSPEVSRISSSITFVQGSASFSSSGAIDSFTAASSSAYVRITGFSGLSVGAAAVGLSALAFLLISNEL